MTPGKNVVNAIIITVVFAVGGCMTTRIEETKNVSTGIKKGEAVVILASSYHATNPAEDSFIECLSDAVIGGRTGLNVHPASEFKDALFPWLEPRTAPTGVDGLPELLKRPGVHERVRERDIRYIIWIEGDTERKSGGAACPVQPVPAQPPVSGWPGGKTCPPTRQPSGTWTMVSRQAR